jgi:hypothetical protein
MGRPRKRRRDEDQETPLNRVVDIAENQPSLSSVMKLSKTHQPVFNDPPAYSELTRTMPMTNELNINVGDMTDVSFGLWTE